MDKDITISGINTSVTVSTDGAQRHFTYQPGAHALTLRDLTLSHGAPQNPELLPGGSIYVGAGGTLTVGKVLFDQNIATFGGAIFVEESGAAPAVSIVDSRFLRNRAAGTDDNFNERGFGALLGFLYDPEL
ncbi:MAG: hypothetical protein ACLFP6_11090 [Spirochaetaceae bacterium]